MWVQGLPKLGKRSLSVALFGTLVAATGCAKNASKEITPPPTSLTGDTSIVTGSIASPEVMTAPKQSAANQGTVSGVKTASLGGGQTAVATRTKSNRLSLAFPKKGYTLSGKQSAQLSKFVQDAKRKNKRVKVVGIATPTRGKKSKSAQKEAREEANRRAKATSMFLRVYGLQDKDMVVTTADQKYRKGVNPRRVEVLIQ